MNAAGQHHSTGEARVTAVQNAQSDVRKVRWFFIGCFGNILGVLIASVYEPTPSASRFLGKSPEYAAVYTDSYKAENRNIQVSYAIRGLVLFCGLGVLSGILL